MRAFVLRLATVPALAIPLPIPLPAQGTPATVATHYFYWYRWPNEHFNEPGAPGREGHARHFAEPTKVSYLSADWHRANFTAMRAAGIDVALPVYWGAPGAYERPNLAFSRRGLPPMVEALDAMTAAGETPPKLGLFYDTSTLANDVCGRMPRGGRTDLTTDAGIELFCTTVTDYFAAIPARHRARHRGGALVVLYVSAFASRHDATLGGALRERFAELFPGEQVCLVADASWGDIGQDLTTAWGAALWGPKLFPGVAQIGAGYDDRPVPGRRTPVREREDGAFYANSWRAALRHRPELVLLETWNEMHEGTELCPTREEGRRYLELTAAWVRRLRAGEDGGEPVAPQYPEPRARPDLSWGEEAKGRREVAVDFAAGTRRGLREVVCEDGPCGVDGSALRPGRVPATLGNYLYFQVSDHFAFDVDGDFELEVRSHGDARLWLEYDSRDAAATLAGAYTALRPARSERDGDGLVETYRLTGARFANRQNGGADFRLVLPQRTAAIGGIVLRRL
ncbi:MAG: hypothetical protein KDC98_13305 [Planctomycetes bacterium]|nr:hypothetical protein [Planctomycetota bacterium]